MCDFILFFWGFLFLMISVGSRNGRKGIEFSYGSEEMAETELEEGEACFQNEDDDSAIDPDIALSYIVSYSVFTFFFFIFIP